MLLPRPAAPAPYRLTLQDAIQKALQANLNVLVCRWQPASMRPRARSSAARRPRCFRASMRKPMPTCRTAICAPSASRCRAFRSQRRRAFSNYDFRIYAQQNVIDLRATAPSRPANSRRRRRQNGRAGRARPDCPLHRRALSECAIRRCPRGCCPIARDGFNHAAQTGQRQARCRHCDRRGRAARPGATRQRQAGPARRAECS
jgi:hypothetical protein